LNIGYLFKDIQLFSITSKSWTLYFYFFNTKLQCSTINSMQTLYGKKKKALINKNIYISSISIFIKIIEVVIRSPR